MPYFGLLHFRNKDVVWRTVEENVIVTADLREPILLLCIEITSTSAVFALKIVFQPIHTR